MIKLGVKLDKLQPQMVLAYAMVQKVFNEYHFMCMITSGNEWSERRLPTSKHYEGMALDFRSKLIPLLNVEYIIQVVRDRLGKEYDVVLKHRGEEQEHLHIEYDPK